VNKRLIIFGVLLAAMLLSAVSPWPATLMVGNFTGDNVYITLKYRGVQKYFLTATKEGNSDTYHWSVFDITRRSYSATVTACQTTVSGTMDLNTNLQLRFTSCDSMRQWWTPKYLKVDRSLEKPNFYSDGYYNPNNIKSKYGTVLAPWTGKDYEKKFYYGTFMFGKDKKANLYQKLNWWPYQFAY